MAEEKGSYSEKERLKQLHDTNEEEGVVISHEDEDDDDESLVPDGGWGWMVCGASFMVNFILDGTMFSFGILLLELLDDLKENKSVTSWVGSALVGMSMMMGPVVSLLLKRFSIRQVTIAGTLLSTVGFIASVFAPNVFVLIIMYGVVGGTGFSMIFLPAIIVVGLYFNKKRAIATGIATSGSGLGTFAYAYLCDYLLGVFTWRQTILILTGILLNCLACGMIFRPLVPMSRSSRRYAKSEASRSSSREGESESSDSSSTYYEFEEGEKTAMVKKRNEWRRGSGDAGVGGEVKGRGKGSRSCEWLHRSETGLAEEEKKKVGQKHGDVVVIRSDKDFSSPLALSVHSQQLRNSRHRHHRHHHHHHHKHHPYHHHHKDASVRPPYSDHVCGGVKVKSALPPALLPAERLYHSVGNFCEQAITPPAVDYNDKLLYFSETQLAPDSPPEELVRELTKEHITQGLLRPILRKDIYYSGSVSHLAEYQQCGRSMTSFLAQMTQPISDDSGCSVSTAGESGEVKERARRKCSKCMRGVLDKELFGNKAFLCLLVTFTMWTVQSVVLIYLPNLAVSKGVARDQAALLISIVGITNTAGRVLAGVVTDMSRMRSIWLYVVALFVAAVVNYLIPWCNTFGLLASVSAVFGFCMAVAVSMRTIVLAEQLGIQVLTQSFGVVALFQGLAFTVNPPIAGKLFDESGAYFWPFTMSGTMYLISALSSLVVALWFKPLKPTATTIPSPSIIRISVEELVSQALRPTTA